MEFNLDSNKLHPSDLPPFDNEEEDSKLKKSKMIKEEVQKNNQKNSLANLKKPKTESKKRFFGSKNKEKVEVQVLSEDVETAILGDIFIPDIILESEGPRGIFVLEVSKDDFIVGKSKEKADGIVTFNPAISREHIKIKRIDGQNHIKEMGSTNGTKVNKKRIGQEYIALFPGDEIILADTRFVVKVYHYEDTY
ncbi:MAG: FHA domain-containing protein [Eubacteriaceae bacterium]